MASSYNSGDPHLNAENVHASSQSSVRVDETAPSQCLDTPHIFAQNEQCQVIMKKLI